ncbi:MAG: response regulator transcription factor [Candidatus Nitrohelix vancouverensis]|uniref:Response regulator transcription factor n=1 Tax=Candidatus Nitrohelix vancouverensis TaxID=2705534 RepID=A0A7T0C230_9BACT|nr:MAG: response regulator transcription factor [Candidatus Nitrohelix vancouverensis]
MGKEKVLVVEDEEDIQELLAYNLTKEGYEVYRADTGEMGLEQFRSKNPDLVLLDLMLPGLSGLEVCRKIREDSKHANVPIVMLTAKGEESDVVKGLELGADDYVTKPFSLKVLITRIRAVLRRSPQKTDESGQTMHFPDLEINLDKHEVRVKEKNVTLTLSEFSILHALAQRPGWVFTRSQIVNWIRGDDYAVTDRSIDFQIVGLRKKLGAVAHYVETVRGVGYRFKDFNEE